MATLILEGVLKDYSGSPQTAEATIKSRPLFHGCFFPLSTYSGEFGFDWMRDRNAYPGSKIHYAGISEDFSLLEAEYDVLDIPVENQEAKYYVPWLNMFPDNKSVTGKDVELFFRVNPCNGDGVYDFEDDDYVEFVSPGGNLKVTPDKVSGLDLYNGKSVKINCLKPLTANDYIEAVYRSKNLTTEGEVVGKINVLKNDITYFINIYVVKNYISDANETPETINSKIRSIGEINGIEDYLNKHSLNQALIQVKLYTQYDKKDLNWPIRLSTLQAASNGKNSNPTTDDVNKDYIFQQFFKGLLDSNNKVNQSKFLNYINFRFGNMFPAIGETQKCILLYLTSLDSISAGGTSSIFPTNNKHCIVYNPNLGHKATYAHEIGHILGLLHTFTIVDRDGKTVSHEDERKILLSSFQKKYGLYKSIEVNNLLDVTHRRFVEKYIKGLKRSKESDCNTVYDNNKIRFKKGLTDNVMDYSRKLLFFSKSQWKVMQTEVELYYGIKK
ncbi:hypothetical protein [Culturomica massiliensis]|uniref:hypothetical protein n=1 Tax=Culturomica massiliensis TaxID=1841857 RepID=UPI003AB8C130